jgi:predicted  nucleic acid-binding Zn-ribbon protein
VQPVIVKSTPKTVPDDALSSIHPSLHKYFDKVSHQTFLTELGKTWEKAYKSIGSEKFDLVFGYSYGLGYATEGLSLKPKSEHWVAGLLLSNHKNFRPNLVYSLFCEDESDGSSVETENQDDSSLNTANDGSSVNTENDDSSVKSGSFSKNIVIVDDASYSGTQISATIIDLQPPAQTHLHIVVPYISNIALNKLKETIDDSHSSKFSIYSTKSIKHITDIEIEEEINDPVASCQIKELGHLTIFSHKIADSDSIGIATKEMNPPYKIDSNTISYSDFLKQKDTNTRKRKVET